MTDEAPKHPGKILFEQVMTPLGVSRNKLARDIDVPVGRISDIVAGKRGITPDTALRFAKYFGTTPELWLRLQADYDLHVVRTTTWAKAETKVAVLEPASAPAQPLAQSPVPSPTPPAEAPVPTPAPPSPAAPPAMPAGAAVPQADATPDAEEASDMDAEADLDAEDDIDIPEPVPGDRTP